MPMLRFTLILPSDDDQEARRLLQDAIDDLQVILMIVISTQNKWVEWADQLAAKGSGPGLPKSFRRIVWVRQPGPLVTECLKKCLAGKNPPNEGVLVLNFHDKVVATLKPNEVRPLTLEEAFIKGHK